MFSLAQLWVRWFGDHTFTQVEPEKLKTLSEGLEAHHHARKKYRRYEILHITVLLTSGEETMLKSIESELKYAVGSEI